MDQSNEQSHVTEDKVEELNEETYEEVDGTYRYKKHHNDCGPEHSCGCKDECECECECVCKPHHHKPKCEPCEIEADECMKNKCGPECCYPIHPDKFSINNSIPYAIETNRVYDTMKFQKFTDAGNIDFKYEVEEVDGHVPTSAEVSIVIEKICINYEEIEIIPGTVTLEDFILTPVEQIGETTFERGAFGDRNKKCCAKGKGESVVYKEKGLEAVVKNLVLELKGKCGCTEVVVYAYPGKFNPDGSFTRYEYVPFNFNTLSAAICVPANGRSFALRQDYQVALTVDCIGKAYLVAEKKHHCKCHYDFYVPNGIDLILCLEEVVSILTTEQIVVLGSAQGIKPRIVDNFTKVCDFPICGPEEVKPEHGGHCD